jgi:hypothetical protein
MIKSWNKYALDYFFHQIDLEKTLKYGTLYGDSTCVNDIIFVIINNEYVVNMVSVITRSID